MEITIRRVQASTATYSLDNWRWYVDIKYPSEKTLTIICEKTWVHQDFLRLFNERKSCTGFPPFSIDFITKESTTYKDQFVRIFGVDFTYEQKRDFSHDSPFLLLWGIRESGN